MPLRNVFLANFIEIANSYLDNVIDEAVSEWHLTEIIFENIVVLM